METLHSGAPVLAVRDIDKAAQFLSGRLGFEITDRHGSPASFAIASRNGCTLMLRRCQFLETRIAPDWSVYFDVGDAAKAHTELKALDAPVSDLIDKDYGIREFEVAGPERHVLVFGQKLDTQPASDAKGQC